MALSPVQHATNNLRIHHNLLNKSYSTTTHNVKMNNSSTNAVRLCSGIRSSYGLAPQPPPCSIVRSPRQHRRSYSSVSLSDAAPDEDDFYTFEKFTEKAIYVVTLAKDEAKRCGYDLFGAEHVLLAIISEGQSHAAKILIESMGIKNVGDARNLVEITFYGRGSRFDANRVFKRSVDSAHKLGVDPTCTRKQLLGWMDEQNMDMLERYATNLTKLARSTEIQAGPVLEHYTKEVAQEVIKTLCTPLSENICLIGDSRVVNTEIVRKLAQQIACGKAPEEISGKQVIMLHMERLVGTSEELQKELFQEIKVQSHGGIILFVDDIQTLITTMGEDRIGDLIDHGELQCICTASMEEEYERNKFVMTRFLGVEVPEPSSTESVFILRKFVSGKIQIADEAILASVYLSRKFNIMDSFVDGAYDLIEDANSLVKKYRNYSLARKWNDDRHDILESDIRNIISLRLGVPLEEIAPMKYIVAEMTLQHEVYDKMYERSVVCSNFTKRLGDRLTHWYNPSEFLEGKSKSPIDSRVLSDLLNKIENEIDKREIKQVYVVVDYDGADDRFIVQEVM